jgi:hypothetical protein|tara:strand:+ start:1744 stop:2103 length:360 start_codon:yes stop_codon:yes gene_type:complete
MARATIAPIVLNGFEALAPPTATTINAANDMLLPVSKRARAMILEITNTDTSPHDVTFPSLGTTPFAVTIANGTTKMINVPVGDTASLDSEVVSGVRSIHIDFATGHTGAVSAYEVVRF